VGDELQGAAADCNSAGATRAWFDSRVAHHSLKKYNKNNGIVSRTSLSWPKQIQWVSSKVSRNIPWISNLFF